MDFELFLIALFVHLIYDFHLQGDFIATKKAESDFILSVHCLTWSLFIVLVLSVFVPISPLWLVFLFLTHFITDRWKSRLPKNENYFWAIYVDQAIHLLTLIFLVYFI